MKQLHEYEYLLLWFSVDVFSAVKWCLYSQRFEEEMSREHYMAVTLWSANDIRSLLFHSLYGNRCNLSEFRTTISSV
jgi:hypothetical protein